MGINSRIGSNSPFHRPSTQLANNRPKQTRLGHISEATDVVNNELKNAILSVVPKNRSRAKKGIDVQE